MKDHQIEIGLGPAFSDNRSNILPIEVSDFHWMGHENEIQKRFRKCMSTRIELERLLRYIPDVVTSWGVGGSSYSPGGEDAMTRLVSGRVARRGYRDKSGQCTTHSSELPNNRKQLDTHDDALHNSIFT
jgi:hypothetical protein